MTSEQPKGRLIHLEPKGRRRPEGWAKEEIAQLRKMKKKSKAQRKEQRR